MMRMSLSQLGKRFLRNLAERGHREVVAKVEPFGQLEFSDLLVLQKLHQLGELEVGAGLEDEAGAHPLAEVGVRNRDAGDILHARMRQDQIFDLLGADLLAAAVDEILLSSLDDVV